MKRRKDKIKKKHIASNQKTKQKYFSSVCNFLNINNKQKKTKRKLKIKIVVCVTKYKYKYMQIAKSVKRTNAFYSNYPQAMIACYKLYGNAQK